jgi:hypothetical protein
MAMTMVRRTGISGWAPTEQIAGSSVNCYSSQASLGAKPLTFDFTEVIPLPSFSLRLGFRDAGIDRNVHIAWAYSSRAASCIRKLRNKLPRQPSNLAFQFRTDLIFVSGRGTRSVPIPRQTRYHNLPPVAAWDDLIKGAHRMGVFIPCCISREEASEQNSTSAFQFSIPI